MSGLVSNQPFKNGTCPVADCNYVTGGRFDRQSQDVFAVISVCGSLTIERCVGQNENIAVKVDYVDAAGNL
jgi:hypothetical protein